MTDRERLIELIGRKSFCPSGITYCHQCRYYDVARIPVCDGVAAIADYLIANGVTVPKRGRWITYFAGGEKYAECSECHVCGSPQWKVCPVCETKMEAGCNDG